MYYIIMGLLVLMILEVKSLICLGNEDITVPLSNGVEDAEQSETPQSDDINQYQYPSIVTVKAEFMTRIDTRETHDPINVYEERKKNKRLGKQQAFNSNKELGALRLKVDAAENKKTNAAQMLEE